MPTTLQKRMSAKNKAFWAKSKEAKRIAVAKDVLKQINSGFLKVKTGDYVYISSLKGEIEVPKQADEMFKKLKRKKAVCRVCALGSCFVSLVNLGNNFKSKSVVGTDRYISEDESMFDTGMRILLRKIFDSEQLTLIECAFETTTNLGDGKIQVDFDKRNAARDFGCRFKTPKSRLTAIMNNIIKNKGIFIP